MRAQRVAQLIKEELGRLVIREYQDATTGFMTVTRVEMPADLRTAHVFVAVFGTDHPEAAVERLEAHKGAIRRALASTVKLKYNPELFFALDHGPEHDEKIGKLIEMAKKHDS